MSIECGECEHDLRGGHAKDCSRYNRKHYCPKCESADIDGFSSGNRQCNQCGHRWKPKKETKTQMDSPEKIIAEMREFADICATGAQIPVREWADRLAALKAAQPAVPEGWKLVPCEPTAQSIYAGVCAYEEETGGDRLPDADGHDHNIARAMYRAMLAAAPPSQPAADEPVACVRGVQIGYLNDGNEFVGMPGRYAKDGDLRLYARPQRPDLEKAREALKPFAKAYNEWSGNNAPAFLNAKVCPADFMRAAEALASLKSGR